MRASWTVKYRPWCSTLRPVHSLAHDLDGLVEHLDADVGRRPRGGEDVLVERLAGADP